MGLPHFTVLSLASSWPLFWPHPGQRVCFEVIVTNNLRYASHNFQPSKLFIFLVRSTLIWVTCYCLPALVVRSHFIVVSGWRGLQIHSLALTIVCNVQSSFLNTYCWLPRGWNRKRQSYYFKHYSNVNHLVPLTQFPLLMVPLLFFFLTFFEFCLLFWDKQAWSAFTW